MHNCISLTVKMIFYGFLVSLLVSILNIYISYKLSKNVSLSSPFTIFISRNISKYNKKCVSLDKKIRSMIF